MRMLRIKIVVATVVHTVRPIAANQRYLLPAVLRFISQPHGKVLLPLNMLADKQKKRPLRTVRSREPCIISPMRPIHTHIPLGCLCYALGASDERINLGLCESGHE